MSGDLCVKYELTAVRARKIVKGIGAREED